MAPTSCSALRRRSLVTSADAEAEAEADAEADALRALVDLDDDNDDDEEPTARSMVEASSRVAHTSTRATSSSPCCCLRSRTLELHSES